MSSVLSLGAQAATLSVANYIELLVIDGKKVEQSGWNKAKEVELANGQHQVVVRFDGEVKRDQKVRFILRDLICLMLILKIKMQKSYYLIR